MLFLLAAGLELMRHLPERTGQSEAPSEDASRPTAEFAGTAGTRRLFTPRARIEVPRLSIQHLPQSDVEEIAAPLSRYTPVKQRANRAQAGSRFAKVSFEGDILPAEATYWSCARDLASGLLWETKLSNAGISDVEHTYSWYQSERNNRGRPDGGNCFGVRCDTEAYAREMNRLALCGSSTWRLPSHRELDALIDRNYYDPTINQEYFPNTRGTVYWTATELENNPEMVMQIDFFNGMSTAVRKNLSYSLRLVSP